LVDIFTYYARIIRSDRRQSFRFTIILLCGFDSKSQCYSPTRDRGPHVCREPATEDGFSSCPVLLFNRIMNVFIASLSPVCGIKIYTLQHHRYYIQLVRLRVPIVMPTNNNYSTKRCRYITRLFETGR